MNAAAFRHGLLRQAGVFTGLPEVPAKGPLDVGPACIATHARDRLAWRPTSP